MADEPTDQEAREALLRLEVADVVVSSASTIASLGFARLAPEGRDLEQAKLAIEALRGLLPAVKHALPADLGRDLESATASLQLAYAAAVEEASKG